MRSVKAQAPANIALVKYMGKADSERNLPANGSLSVTLSGLQTVTELRERSGRLTAQSRLVAGNSALSEKELLRASRHYERVRERVPAIFARFGLKLREVSAEIELHTENSFPSSSGIASSASGLAALTLATAALLCDDSAQAGSLLQESPEFREELAALSRMGSGSSCRSFDGPLVVWEGERARKLSCELPALAHLVLVVSTTPKKVSSSEAHRRVATSPLWGGRPERAKRRLSEMQTAFARRDLGRVALLAWDEAWEMHSLFHTSEDPFTYWEPDTLRALRFFESEMKGRKPPVVTLDAGPNIHVFAAPDELSALKIRLREQFPQVGLLDDVPGAGAGLL